MQRVEKVAVMPSTRIRDALQKIDELALQIVAVVNDEGRLVGSVTDGDARRGILQGLSLEEPVSRIMNSDPLTADPQVTWPDAMRIMHQHRIHQLFIVNEAGILIGLVTTDGTIIGVDLDVPADPQNKTMDVPVVILAGGLGTRLRPLTEDIPKPLLQIGDRPLLETTIKGLARRGFRRIFLAVNYKADMVKAHFSDGSAWGMEISYLHEDCRLGTAGPISLLPEVLETPVMVINGDLLTSVNYNQLLDFHRDCGDDLTMCVREYTFTVPYGVAALDGHHVEALQEKPEHTFFINAGVYVLSPQAIAAVPPNQYFDMTQLVDEFLAEGRKVNAFPIREYWLDIGQMADYEQALNDIDQLVE
ncbi:MAG: nucleotidyltransferase family protein [Nitrococcus sp.]|nr:nucleotidyltransferase family protein [Nitrococcus sp.]